MCPGRAPKVYTNSNVLTGTLIASQFYNNTIAYALSDTGLIQKMSYIGSTPSITSPALHTIAGTSPVGQDMLFYSHNSGGTAPANQVTSLFYSYYNNANWDVGAVDGFGGAETFDDDFMSSIPATPLDITSGDGDDVNQRTAPHPLCVGADGVLYIGSGRYLHAYDGSVGNNGTFYSKILTFAQGTQIVSMVKYQDTLLIAANYYSTGSVQTTQGTGEAIVYIWNYLDLNTTQTIPLEDPYVSAIFIYKGTPTVITNGIEGRNGTNKIKVVTGISTTKIADFNGTIPIQRGIVPANDILYLNCGGRILAYGNKYSEDNAINWVGTCSNPSASGFLAYNWTNQSLMAASTTCMNNFDNAGTDNGFANSFYYEPPLPPLKRARLKYIQIIFPYSISPNVSNGSITFSVNTDYGTTTNIINAATSMPAPITRKYSYSSTGTALPEFNSIGIGISWVASTLSLGIPYISKVIAEYQIVEVKSNTTI